MDVENINKEIESILNSGAHSDSKKTSPFFTAQVMAKVEQLESNRNRFTNWGYILKPGIAALLVFNLANYMFTSNVSENSDTETEQSGSEILLAEYSNTSEMMAYYEDYLNIE